ncbi:hypothetical protein ACFP1Z_09030 [Streptomyces gamaensis]|uniref:Lipoprotein n=1 Tax=Streptomyces gamaensis TaxID=1763542 RepID=A0ABW0YYJ1_9ACTN
MRQRALPAVLFALAVVFGCAVPLVGCHPLQRIVPGRAAGAEPGAARTSTAADRTGGTGIFLDRDTCAMSGGGSWFQVDCADARASARVLARYSGPESRGPRCPEPTDFVLGITGEAHAREGYACLRNLRPPHPGDPGMGGGPLTVTGDCVATEPGGLVRETACDGSGPRAPQYKITREVEGRAECPPETDLYVHVGGGTPIGCARRLQ